MASSDETVKFKVEFETDDSKLNTVGKTIEGQVLTLKELKKAYKEAQDQAIAGNEETINKVKTLKDQIDKVNNSFKDQAVGLKDLKKQFKEAMNEAATGSAEAAKRAGQLKDQIEDTKKAVNSFNGDPVENLSRGFRGLKDTLFNLDFKGFTEEVSRLKSISKGLSFGELVSSVKDTAKAFISLGQVLLTNPIFLIAAAIAGIIAALAYFSNKSSKEAKEAFDGLTKSAQQYQDALDSIHKQQDAVSSGELKLAKAYGASADEINKLTLKQSYLETERAKAALSSNEQTIALKRQLYSKLKDEDKAAALDEIKNLENKSNDIKTQLINEAFNRQLINKEYLNKKVADATKAEEDTLKKQQEVKDKNDALQKEKTKTYNEEAAKRKKADDDELQAEIDRQLEYAKIADAAKKKAADERTQASNDLQEKNKAYQLELGTKQEQLDKQKEEDEAEVQALFDKSQQTVADKQALADALLAIDQKYNEDTQALDQKTADKKKELLNQQLNDTLSIAQQSNASLLALSDIYFQYQLKGVEKGSKRELEIKKKQFKVEKALKVAMIVIETVLGGIKALANNPPPNPIGIISAALIGVAGTLATVKVLATKFDEGGSSGGGGSSAPASIPAIPDQTASGANPAQINNSAAGINTGNTVGNGNRTNIATQPQKVYVTQTDIADQNKKVEVIQNRASY